MEALPAWRITQPASEESNWLVKKRGRGVGVGSRVGVGSGVCVSGTGVGRGVVVGKRGGTGVGVAVWQADVRRRNPIRRHFFIMIL